MIIYIADGTRASLHIYLPSSESLESSLEEKEESKPPSESLPLIQLQAGGAVVA
jgi:hypothetical protein